MGACLCKSKRRAPNDAFRPDPAGLFQSGTSTSSSTSGASSSSAASGSSQPSPVASTGGGLERPAPANANAASIRSRLHLPQSLLDALALTSSSLDLSSYLSHNKQAGQQDLLASQERPLAASNQHSQSQSQSGGRGRGRNQARANRAEQPTAELNCHQNNEHSAGATRPNNRIWSLQNKLSVHADRLVIETLDSIKPTALNEPSNAMQKLHLISETELGWLVVINSLINKVDLEHPFGSALILLILEDAPLPTKKSIYQLDEVLGLQMGHERSVARQRNISIVLACLAEKLAGTFSNVLFSDEVQSYLLSRIEPERNEPIVILYSLIALEKFSQTTDNKLAIMRRLNALGANNPLLRLERWAQHKQALDFVRQQVAFCATWDLDNHFLYEGRPYSYETVDRDNLNVMLNSRDASENLKISANGLMARNDTSRFESVRCTSAITSGIYYYEVQLITPGVMQIGFATKQSKFLNHDGFGIGDDDQSFAYDGCRQLLWQNAKSSHTNLPRWKEGDIVGCLIDLDKFEIRFSLNGQMCEPSSELFRNKPLSTQYYAAASFMPFQQCAFNFGRYPFVHPPEYHNFRTLNQCGQLRDDERYIIPRHLILKKINSANPPFLNACNICCDNAAQVTLEPCEHDGLCETCASLLDLCPLCRTRILARRVGSK